MFVSVSGAQATPCMLKRTMLTVWQTAKRALRMTDVARAGGTWRCLWRNPMVDPGAALADTEHGAEHWPLTKWRWAAWRRP